MVKTVGIRYCGLCNPEIDAQKLVESIRHLLGPGIEVTEDLSGRIDRLIVINGCRTGCLRIPGDDNSGRVIYINGSNIGHSPVVEEQLAGKIFRIITGGEDDGR